MAVSTIKRGYAYKTKMVTCETRTIANGNLSTYDIEVSEPGYACFPIQVMEFRTFVGWYVHTKNCAMNHIVFDYCNETGNSISATPIVYFLCIPT